MTKILITGSSGMLAQELIKQMLDFSEYEIWAASRKQTLGLEHKQLHMIQNDQLEMLFSQNQIDLLIHCAFPRNVSDDKWASGIKFGIDLMFMAKKYNVKRVIHVSSQSIYGWDRSRPAIETDQVKLCNPYGTGKYCMEELVNHVFSDIPHANIRLSTIIGIDSEERITNKFLHQAIADENINIRGGNQFFSFLDVRDGAGAIIKMIRSDNVSWNQLYNVGTQEYYSLMEIARKAIETVPNSKSVIQHTDADIVLNNRLDCEKFYEDFGWKAQYSLEDSLNFICEHYNLAK